MMADDIVDAMHKKDGRTMTESAEKLGNRSAKRMTVRQRFAMAAMQARLVNAPTESNSDPEMLARIARRSAQAADALLEELAKEVA